MAGYLKFRNMNVGNVIDAFSKAVNENMRENEKVTVAGKSHSKSQLLARLAALSGPYQAAEQARVEYESKLDERREAEPSTQAFVQAFVEGVHTAFDSAPTTDKRFGIPPLKNRRALTVAEKSTAVGKMSDTRKAFNTMGPRQKAKAKAGLLAASGPAPSGDATPAPIPASGSSPTAVDTSTSPAPSGSSTPSATVNGSNGVQNGVVAPMLMNGTGH